MEVIVPEYIVAPGVADRSGSAILLSSSVGLDPIEQVWSPGEPYSAGAVVYYLDTQGDCVGCWCEYSALQPSTGKIPEDEPAYWLSAGAVQSYKMFDQYIDTVSRVSDDVTITIHCTKITDIAFLNMQAQAVIIDAWNAAPSAVYPYIDNCNPANKIIDSYAIDLRESVSNWYEWFFKDFEFVTSVASELNLQLYQNIIVRLSFIRYPGVDCFIGGCIPGRKYYIGEPMDTLSAGVINHSRIVFNEDFGTHKIIPRGHRKTLECDLRVLHRDFNLIDSILIQLLSRPTIYQANPDGVTDSDLLVYGILKRYLKVRRKKSYVEIHLEIEGLL